MVFTLGISGVVSAFEAASGALVWQTDAPDSLPIYGNPVSPLGVGELVIVHPGDYGRWCAETSVRRGPGHRDGRRGMIST